MGGIHATMCLDEIMKRVDSVVTGEVEGIWPRVLEDARHGHLKRRYDGGFAEIGDVPFARHDLLATGYPLGAIQTTWGRPLNRSFLRRRMQMACLAGSLSYRSNLRLNRKAFADFKCRQDDRAGMWAVESLR
jgi:hypothetical protein